MILGKSKQDWRVAYFTGKINDLLDETNKKTVPSEDEIKKLDEYLETIQKEREKLKISFSKYQKTDKIKLPEVSELMSMTKEQIDSIEEWEKLREEDYKRAREIFELAKVSEKIGVHNKQWLDWGFELASLQYNLDVLRVWRDQLYRGKMIDIMDTYGCSRREAEDRAKVTVEYRKYKNAVLFRELTEEVIMLCKKYYSN